MSGFGPSTFFTPPISNPYMPRGPHGRFSLLELRHIAIAYGALTLALFMIWTRPTWGLAEPAFFYEVSLIAGAAAALTGFLAHEMAHKFVAQARGLWSEFRMSPQGLMIALVFAALLGFLFAAPGATMIGGGRNDPRERGVTSLAGPAMNMAEGYGIMAVFLAVVQLRPDFWWSTWAVVVSYVIFINFVFAVFNLIPWGPLDGLKVYHWSKGLWGASIAVALAGGVMTFLFLQY